jgi:mono/diheme cytochrome c family protein
MSPVVHDGLTKLPDSDIKALATYFADVSDAATRAGETEPAIREALAVSSRGVGLQYDSAARLYTAACASCHYNGGDAVNPLRPDLALNSAVNLSDPTNLIHVTLDGISAPEGAPGIVMPGFARGLTDADIASIAAYLRATRTSRTPWPDLEKTVAAIRAEGKEK